MVLGWPCAIVTRAGGRSTLLCRRSVDSASGFGDLALNFIAFFDPLPLEHCVINVHRRVAACPIGTKHVKYRWFALMPRKHRPTNDDRFLSVFGVLQHVLVQF